VRAAEARVGRAGGLDGVGEALRGQAVSNPAGQPGEGQRDRPFCDDAGIGMGV